MPIKVDEAIEHANALKQDYAKRDEMLNEIDKMYFLEWDDKPDDRAYKFTVSPSARNALLGAIRLMTSTEPKFNVPHDKNNKDARDLSEKIEKFCHAIWYHSGRFKGVPLEQPAVESLLRYGIMCLAITDTEDLMKISQEKGVGKAQLKQLERLTKSTPFLIEAWDPKTIYPEWGRYGLESVYREVEMRVAEVEQQFGAKAVQEILGKKGEGSKNDLVTYADYWDLDKHIAWISLAEGNEISLVGDPILDVEHELPCIPIVVQTAEGSYMDVERERQAVPFLYTVLKTKLWERQNLELTVMYTNLFNLAASPTFLHETMGGEGDLVTDFDTPGGRIVLKNGEKFQQLRKDVITADMLQGLNIATGLIEQSTIYSQSLGQPLGANSAFSMVALLHQAGRLPLASPQKRGGWSMGGVMENIMEIVKDKKKANQVLNQDGGFIEIDDKEIPDDLIINAILDVDLPQDMLSQVNIAGMATQNGLASRRWVREKVMNIGQSEAMDKEIWNEQAGEILYQQTLQKLIEAGMQPPGGIPQEGMPPGGMPPPEEMMGMPGEGSAINTQEGLIPATRPGQQPAPPSMQPRGPQEGEMR